MLSSPFWFLEREEADTEKSVISLDFLSYFAMNRNRFNFFLYCWLCCKIMFALRKRFSFQFANSKISEFFQLTVVQILSGESHCGPRKICGGRMRKEYFPSFSAFQLSSLAGHLDLFNLFRSKTASFVVSVILIQYALCTALQREQ